MRASYFALMTDRPKTSRKHRIITAAVVLVFIAILGALVLMNIYRCPFKAVTGYPCPFCGITRAYLSLFIGDIQASFHYHPLWPVITVTIIAEVLNELRIIKIPNKVNNIALIIVAALLVICYIWRFMSGNWVYL